MAELAKQMQLAAGIYLPLAYTLGRSKVQKQYNIIRPWGMNDQVNVELLLHRHSEELARSFARIEERVSQGEELSDLLNGLTKRLSAWSWVLYPALAAGMAAGVNETRREISHEENIPADDIGIIWYNAKDNRVCDTCLYLTGRWFDAREAYDLAAKVHPGCRCPAHFDIGTPNEAIVAPIAGYRPGTAQDVYRDLNVAGLAQARISRARQINARGGSTLPKMVKV
ncbi:MAG TPA: hypothetical protein VLH15_03205 [Dehalococcoidales bacterium]|nr:hypothetical protein [Dehalococcoidales bacterium]